MGVFRFQSKNLQINKLKVKSGVKNLKIKKLCISTSEIPKITSL